MAVALADPAVAVVDFEFGPLGPAHLAASGHGLGLPVVVTAGSLCAATLYIPAPTLAGYYMMGGPARFTRHICLSTTNEHPESTPTPNFMGCVRTVVKNKKYRYSERGTEER